MSLVREEGQGYNEDLDELPTRQELARLTPSSVPSTVPEMRRIIPTHTTTYETAPPSLSQSLDAYSEILHYRISDDCKVKVLFEGRVTQEAIKKLIAHLQLGMDDFPSKAQVEKAADSISVPFQLEMEGIGLED